MTVTQKMTGKQDTHWPPRTMTQQPRADFYTLLDSLRLDGNGCAWVDGLNDATEGCAIAHLDHVFDHVDSIYGFEPQWIASIALSGDSEVIALDETPGWFLATRPVCIHLQPIDVFFATATPTEVDAYLQQYATGLRHVATQTYERCAAALCRDPSILQYIKVRTPELCRLAVLEDASALEYVPHDMRTEELCIQAIRENGYMFTVLSPEEQTEAICNVAVDECPAIWPNVRMDLQTAELRERVATRWPLFSVGLGLGLGLGAEAEAEGGHDLEIDGKNTTGPM